MTPTTLAAANMAVARDKPTNLAKIIDMIGEAGGLGVDFLVFPEAALQGYVDFAVRRGTAAHAEQTTRLLASAEPVPGPATETVREAAAKHDMVVQFGLIEAGTYGNTLYNSVAVVGPRGVLHRFRKIHNKPEYPYMKPGHDTGTVTIGERRVGSLICADILFPELARVYALRGADLLLYSTAWPTRMGESESTGEYMDLCVRSTAFFNQTWVVASNHCEQDSYSERLDYYGGSQIVDPRGEVMARSAADEGLVTYSADLQAGIVAARTFSGIGQSFLDDRRPEHYSLLSRDLDRCPIDDHGTMAQSDIADREDA